MDSMRSLNTSLPRASPGRQTQSRTSPPSQQNQNPTPPDDLLAAFKQAALSVTTLYKSAASLQAPARASGYQDAIEDLLTFLDNENLGLTDGEGWKVRQWASERFEGNIGSQQNGAEDEEETGNEAELADRNTVEPESKDPHDGEDDMSSSMELPSATEPEGEKEQDHDTVGETRSTPSFPFRSSTAYPSNHDRDVSMENETKAPSPETTTTPSTFRFDAPHVPRTVRHRHSRQPISRQSTSTRSLGAGAGSKRRFAMGDFFDISGINFDFRETQDRGGKRTRHV